MADEISRPEVSVHHEWAITEYPVYERDRRWFIIAGIVSIVLLGLAVWYENFLGAVLVLLTAVVMIVRHIENPPELSVSVRGDGIAIGQSFYPYREMKSFWIIYEPPAVKTLYLDFQSQWRPRLPIPLAAMSPLTVRETLLQYLEEDLARESEPTSEALSRLFRL